MKVETFEVLEHSVDGVDEPEEFARLTSELELGGQARFTVASKDEQVKTVPYRKITTEENFVYRELCTSVVKLEDYTSSPVPVRVLQVALHARSLGFFEKLQVWYADDDPDPVLVGFRTDPDRPWIHEHFLLARWGPVLEDFAKLYELARAKCKKRLMTALRRVLVEVQCDLAVVEADGFPMDRVLSTPAYFRVTS